MSARMSQACKLILLPLPTLLLTIDPSAVGLNVDCSEWVRLGLIDEADKLDRNWANWTTFTQVSIFPKRRYKSAYLLCSQDACWSLYVGRDFCVSSPAEAGSSHEAPRPFIDQGFDQMPWVHLPSGMDPQPNNLTKTFAATCELLVISRRIMDVV